MGAFRQNAIWNFMNENRRNRRFVRESRAHKYEPDRVDGWDVKRARFITTTKRGLRVCPRGEREGKTAV